MKWLIFLAVFLTACAQNGKDGSNGLNSTDPTTYQAYSWSDSNPCSGANNFGDAAAGCLASVQIIMVPGGAFVTAVGDLANHTATMSFYVKSSGAWTQNFTDFSGGDTYIFSGDLSTSPPTFSANYDSDGTFGNTSAKSFTLTEE